MKNKAGNASFGGMFFKGTSEANKVDNPMNFDRIGTCKPKWRNWQTRYVQGVVGITLVRVQIPPSALNPQNSGDLLFDLSFSFFWSKIWIWKKNSRDAGFHWITKRSFW